MIMVSKNNEKIVIEAIKKAFESNKDTIASRRTAMKLLCCFVPESKDLSDFETTAKAYISGGNGFLVNLFFYKNYALLEEYAAKKYASRENFDIYFYDEVCEEKLRVSKFDLAHEVWSFLRDELGYNHSYEEENIRTALCSLLA